MFLHKSDIEQIEEVGSTHEGRPVVHVLTKGGLSLVCEQMPSGQLVPLSKGSHPAIARHHASLVKKINYNESLFKSEMHPERVPQVKFDPHMAYELGRWHAAMAGKINMQSPSMDDKTKYISHMDQAIRHLMASGMEMSSAKEEAKKWATLHHGHSFENKPLIDEMKLEEAYYRKHGQDYPKTTVQSYINPNSENDLGKSAGRITYPTDPKITNRPDQEVENVDNVSTRYGAAKLNSTIPLKDQNAYKKKNAENKMADLKNKAKYGSGLTAMSGSDRVVAFANTNEDPSSQEHEALHVLMEKINQKHGTQEAHNFADHLINHIPEDALKFVKNIISNHTTYNDLLDPKIATDRTKLSYKEEILNTLRDLIVSGDKRKYLMGNPINQDVDKRLKSAWNNVRFASKEYKINNMQKSEKEEHLFDLEFAFKFIDNSGELHCSQPNWSCHQIPGELEAKRSYIAFKAAKNFLNKIKGE